MYLSEMKLFERVNYNKMVLFQNQNKKEKGKTSVQYHTIRLWGPMEDDFGEWTNRLQKIIFLFWVKSLDRRGE